MSTFKDLGLSAEQLEAISRLGYTEPTAGQELALPAILADRDVLALAPTGSGKTAAFALGILRSIDIALVQTQALVLCPTRELADQVATQIRKLGSTVANLKVTSITGGMPLGPQIQSLKVHDPHVIVGTPGRVQELLRKKVMHVRSLKVLVLDEADRMLDMGFAEALDDILSRLPEQKQTLMFSATMPDSIDAVAGKHLREPVRVQPQIELQHGDIREEFLSVTATNKLDVLVQLLQQRRPAACVAFCNTRKACDEVQLHLDAAGFSALALHGDYEQRDRDEVMIQFANESANVLVATDVAARGIDISHLDLVVNVDVPFEPEVYVHRIGRTGRAGAKGEAITLVGPTDGNRIAQIEALLGKLISATHPKLQFKPSSSKHLAPMQTIRIDGGKTDKLRPGDILGTLTGEGGIDGKVIGKINITPLRSYVAIQRGSARDAVNYLRNGKIKGRRFRASLIH